MDIDWQMCRDRQRKYRRQPAIMRDFRACIGGMRLASAACIGAARHRSGDSDPWEQLLGYRPPIVDTLRKSISNKVENMVGGIADVGCNARLDFHHLMVFFGMKWRFVEGLCDDLAQKLARPVPSQWEDNKLKHGWDSLLSQSMRIVDAGAAENYIVKLEGDALYGFQEQESSRAYVLKEHFHSISDVGSSRDRVRNFAPLSTAIISQRYANDCSIIRRSPLSVYA